MRTISDDDLENHPEQAIHDALLRKVELTKGQLLFARSAMLGMQPETVAALIEVNVNVYRDWEQSDHPDIPEDKVARLKSVLKCRETQYEALFDSVMTPERVKISKPKPIEPAPTRDALDKPPSEPVTEANHSMAQDGSVTSEPIHLPARSLWSSRISASLGDSVMGSAANDASGGADAASTIVPFTKRPSTTRPPRQSPPSLKVVDKKPWKYEASDYPDIEGKHYYQPSPAMKIALSENNLQEWNQKLKTLIKDNPDTLLDMRGTDLRAMKLNLNQFDFSQCDMRGVNWPKSLHCSHMILTNTQLVNGKHDDSNLAYQALYNTVRTSYESADSKNLTTEDRRRIKEMRRNEGSQRDK